MKSQMNDLLAAYSDSAALLPDAEARARALDETKSFLVQAPAGSGKTELLSDRFLKLLSVVDEPDQVLAITFTRAATAEMRTRIIEKLRKASERAASTENKAGTDSPDVADLENHGGPASAALRRSQERGWQLLDQPQRLNIQTIDGLSLSIAHRTPLLARLGGTLQPTEYARSMYDLAAQRTLQELGGENEELNSALRALLALRDNNLKDCERLLAEMLQQRDQWGHLFLMSGDVDWDAVRAQLEQPLQRAIAPVLSSLHAMISNEAGIAAELMLLTKYVCQNSEAENTIRMFETLDEFPGATNEFLAHWQCWRQLLITGDEQWRKIFTKSDGFPAKNGGAQSFNAGAKARMEALVTRLRAIPGLLDALCAAATLPPPRYTDQQWEMLRHLFTTLRYAVAKLKVIFAEQNRVDFVEAGLAAEMVLRNPPEEPGAAVGEIPVDQALGISDRIRHLLVDEFQDTSRRQHGLLTALLRSWDNCDGRTCFLVGDPMQSIYLFRQAEVQLFDQVSRHGLKCESGIVELETLRLETNFRSHAGLVEPLNKIFASIFGEPRADAVGFTPSVARKTGPGESTVHVQANLLPPAANLTQKHEARRQETAEALAMVRKHWPSVERAQRSGEAFTIAVLVRAKLHAASIAAALRDAGIPFRAVDLEKLRERQEILDLVALSRALAHPMDRVAWLSVLRAPWCGLTLRDLHALCGTDGQEYVHIPILELLDTRIGSLTPDGRQRASATRSVLGAALHSRNRLSASMSYGSWVERTWYSLGGHRCVDATALENVQAFFSMLDGFDANGTATTAEAIDAQLSTLFAQPDPESSERTGVQIMTIHKAKGLGFNVVIVPGLERGTGRVDQPLICWLQRRRPVQEESGPEEEVLVAPIGEKGEKTDNLYRWVQAQKQAREEEERKRLLYVACTRAAEHLYLLGTATMKRESIISGDRSSLLATAWPALEADFQAIVPRSTTPSDAGTGPGDNLLTFRTPPLDGDEVAGRIDLAAGADETAPTERSPLTVRRLPLDLAPEAVGQNVTMTVPFATGHDEDAAAEKREPFDRPQGSLAVRSLGTTVHTLFEKAARSMERGISIAELQAAVPGWRRQALSLLRNHGVVIETGKKGTEALANRAIEAVAAALSDPAGLWILGRRNGAQSETAWTGRLDGALRTLRVDRIFGAGSEPLSEGDECQWIVDFKTASRSPSEVEEFMKEERLKYKNQLEMYGRMLRLAKGARIELRLALYYPLLKRLEHWSM